MLNGESLRNTLLKMEATLWKQWVVGPQLPGYPSGWLRGQGAGYATTRAPGSNAKFKVGMCQLGLPAGAASGIFFGEEAMDPSYSTTKWRSQHFVGSPEMATLGTAKQAKHVGWFHDPKRARRQPLPGTVYTCILNIAAASVLFPNSRHTLPQFPLQLPSPGPMWVATSVVSLFVLGVGGQGPDDSWLKALFHESGLAAGYPLVN